MLGAAALWIYIAIAAIALFHQREINNIALKQFVQKSMGPNSGAPQATDALDLPESQVNVINGVIAQLNLPWRDLLDTLEVATPATIALLSIEPDSKKRTLRGLAEAKTSDDMLDYIGRLNEKPFFLNVRLTKHEINEQDPNRPLRFQFEAQWTEP